VGNWKSKLRYFPCHSVIPGDPPLKCACGKSDCDAKGKHPKHIGWQKEATTDPAKIEAWQSDPTINLAIACGEGSDLFVLDIDGPEGQASLDTLEAEHGLLPFTAMVKTGRGLQRYFRHTPVKVPNKVKFRPGLDVRTEGGLVIAAGARHYSGKTYDLVTDPIELAELPQWLIQVIEAGPLEKAKDKSPTTIKEGARNEVLFKLGSSLRGVGLSHKAIEVALLAENRSRCKPPLPDSEVQGIAKQASHYEQGKVEVVDPDSWRDLFPGATEWEKTEEPAPVLKGIASEGETTAIGALAKNSKTWLMLSIAKALLSGEPWLGKFPVSKSKRVVYLVPEAGMAQMKRRLVLMNLMEYVREGHLYVAPRRPGMILNNVTDTRILKAAEGADVFLDTAVRFVKGDETVENVKVFGEEVLSLATVARTVWFAHHSAKGLEKENYLSLENVLRGSGDFGAFVSNCLGMRQLDKETNLVHVELCAGRDDDGSLKPFHIQGRPYISERADFKLALWEAGPLSNYLKKGRPSGCTEEQLDKIKGYLAQDKTHKEIAELMGVSTKTIQRWLREDEI
jgi:Bifunctional DNA primase/polymerase, N-terminal/AAA domain/Primase C terminal 1 (PriCT-1)